MWVKEKLGIWKNGLVCSGRKLPRGDDGCVGWYIRNVMCFAACRDSIIRGKDLKSVRAAGVFGTKYGLMIRLPFHESIFSAGIPPDFRILS